MNNSDFQTLSSRNGDFNTALTLAKSRNDQAIEILIEALDLKDGDKACEAVKVLSQVKDERIVNHFIEVLERIEKGPIRSKGEAGMVRSLIFDSLEFMGDERAVPVLLRLLVKPEEPLRYMVVAALGGIGKKQAVEPLLALLEDQDFTLRWFAAEALGKIGDKRAVDPLLKALEDENPDVRFGTAVALGRLGDGRALSKLEWVAKNDKGYNFEEKPISKVARTAIKRIKKNQEISSNKIENK
jgi:HEAT repeat protein